MKKALLLSVFMLNLTFGFDIQELEQACNARNNMEACNILVILYSGAVQGYPQNKKKHDFYENKICDFGGEYAVAHCHNIALEYLSKAKKYIKRTCNLTSKKGERERFCEELRKTKLY